ncbi:SMI1/KNR4 family protein [Capnocytophaga canimorsus]|uniref:SMI1/KNR4 family protein n=1 Tax=Capnocytophaga canimorsus TaxID=28188 RepID=UPI001562884E|nr:SMI1/KNR4 family protein [Capnocytophaga canimorsus]GJQ03901.1 hypothetical protein CAPN009_03160 [Capnocytophaga canimorsus]
MNLFREEKLLYKGFASNLSKQEITNLFQTDFEGSKDFLELYSVFDGVDFMREAKMFRSKFYEIPKGELDLINVSFFLKMKDIIIEKEYVRYESEEYQFFINTHIPFADDGSGNTIWLDTNTGLVKRFDHEEDFEEAIIIVAPNFKEFCLSLEDYDPNWIKPIYDNE